MRHKYDTRGIVLARTPLGETNALVTILTEGVGLVRARAQSLRRPGAKLAAALTTLTESSLVLVRGREGWRVTGAILEEKWLAKIERADSRQRASRIIRLLLRLVTGEIQDPRLYAVVKGFFYALATLPSEEQEAVETLAAIRILALLGLDSGEVPGDAELFSPHLLATVAAERVSYVARINRGIEASGL